MSDDAAATPPIRYLEDFSAGAAYDLGVATVTADQIVTFAREFDPQPFHLDESAARESIYGGLIASGMHTLGLFTRGFVEHVLNLAVSLGSPGFGPLEWPAPVRPGDTLRGRWTALECRASRSKPDRGILRGRGELVNQHDQVVLSIETVNFVGRRPSSDV